MRSIKSGPIDMKSTTAIIAVKFDTNKELLCDGDVPCSFFSFASASDPGDLLSGDDFSATIVKSGQSGGEEVLVVRQYLYR